MITLKDWMEIVEYKVTEGSDYCWNSFGSDAYRLDSWNQEQDGYSIGIVFDRLNQTVYTVEACDYKNNRAYRLINPDYKTQYDQESKDRDVDIDQAWDDVNYVDLETDEDFVRKAKAIVAGLDYDTKVTVPIELSASDLLALFKQAHEMDITFNQYVEHILNKKIKEEQV